MLKALTLSAALVLAPLGLTAASWELDKSHAHVTFTVSHLGFSDVHGQFREFDADITFDPENIEATEVTFTIQAASVDTFWEARDNHIRNADFLDVENHPTITFVSTGFEQTGDNTATVNGDLTLRGVTQPVTFGAVLNRIGDHPFQPGKQLAGFTITGEIDRTAFGVDKFAPAIGAVLPVEISFEISPAASDNS